MGAEAEDSSRKNPTLIGSDLARKLMEKERARHGLVPIIIVASLVLVVATIVGLRESIRDAFVGEAAAPSTLITPEQEKARGLLAEGIRLFQKRKIKPAVMAFQQAIELDPQLGQAHRSLGIALATQDNHKDAVAHYKKYLEFTPNAPDTIEVQQIIKDYDAAQKKKEDLDKKAKEEEQAAKEKAEAQAAEEKAAAESAAEEQRAAEKAKAEKAKAKKAKKGGKKKKRGKRSKKRRR
jgi:tetratricopeptide (TPR) repeat protein